MSSPLPVTRVHRRKLSETGRLEVVNLVEQGETFPKCAAISGAFRSDDVPCQLTNRLIDAITI